jgi:hypothetical protein
MVRWDNAHTIKERFWDKAYDRVRDLEKSKAPASAESLERWFRSQGLAEWVKK